MIYDILPVNNYTGNSNTTIFDFDFYIDNEEQLKVYHFDENKIKRFLELNIDYSINEIKNENGSYITFPIEGSEYSVLNENENLSLELSLPLSQETQYNNSSLLNIEALEYSFDYLTRLVQILSRKIDLCVKVEECSDNTPEELLEEINAKAVEMQDALTVILNTLTQIETYSENITAINQNIETNSEKFEKIDELETLMPTKADVDLSNITTTAMAACTHYSMPSDTYDELTFGSSGTTYTAPEDGWFYAASSCSSSSYSEIAIYIESVSLTSRFVLVNNADHTNNISAWVHVKKGEIIYLTYSKTSDAYIRFYYAVGTQSEA